MKQKDIALIVVVVFMSTVISLLISRAIIVKPQDRQQHVEVVNAITDDFPSPDKRYFNKNALNPTKLITINPSTNTDPFSTTNSQNQ